LLPPYTCDYIMYNFCKPLCGCKYIKEGKSHMFLIKLSSQYQVLSEEFLTPSIRFILIIFCYLHLSFPRCLLLLRYSDQIFLIFCMIVTCCSLHLITQTISRWVLSSGI
jgi:ABC-type uncharacterized transport system permease subunit